MYISRVVYLIVALYFKTLYFMQCCFSSNFFVYFSWKTSTLFLQPLWQLPQLVPASPIYTVNDLQYLPLSISNSFRVKWIHILGSEAGLTQREPPKPVHNPHLQVTHKDADVLSRYHWNVALEHECWLKYCILHSIAPVNRCMCKMKLWV